MSVDGCVGGASRGMLGVVGRLSKHVNLADSAPVARFVEELSALLIARVRRSIHHARLRPFEIII